MSLLSYTQICDLIEDGVIENGRYEAVNSASLDIHLGSVILVEKLTGLKQTVSIAKREHLQTEKIDISKEPYILRPGAFILAHSVEIFHLPCDVSAEYKLRSSMARVGLEHLNAGWCDAGWNGSVLTLELRNLTTYHEIELAAGVKIGQMIFFKHMPVPVEKSYASRGSYNGDKSVQGAKANAG
jgi:deoxycytidine triphosphate deaminase